jgi:phospholipid/cholesterol/gamma-HCH transport system substrate-binding protein
MKIKKEYQAAFFGIVTIILFIWGYNFLKGKDLLKNYNTYYGVFDNVDGIDGSTPVKMKGLVIGSIKELNFRPGDRKIVLTVNIDRSYFIPKDSKIKITGSGILGGKNLEVEMGFSPEPARSGDTLQSVTAAGFNELIGDSKQQFEELVYNTNQLIIKLNSTFDDANRLHLSRSLAHIDELTAELSRTAGQLNAMLFENRANLKQTVENLNRTSENVQNLSLQLSRTDYGKLVENLTKSTETLNKILLDLQQGKGSLGKLAKDETLYRNLNETLQSLDILLKDLKERPKRYVHFSVFGKKEKK